MRLVAILLLFGCSRSRVKPAGDAAIDAPLAIDAAAPDAVAPDAAVPDARPDAAPAADAGCDLGCHWDCFGGSQCIDGKVWITAYAPRECCHVTDPWPGPGPICSSGAPHACEGGACAVPDP